MSFTETQIMEWLDEVKDPEIPVLSLVDLGVIASITIDQESVEVEITPTFVGCPALEVMKEDVIATLQRKGVKNTTVYVSFRQPWNSGRITEKGRTALKKFGLAPPPSNHLFNDLEILERATCPRCEGTETELKNPFGPTLCRAIYYCTRCKEAFELFKPL